MSDEKTPFYTATVDLNKGSTPVNLIADRRTAEDIAYVQKEKGMDASLVREKHLFQINETGKSKEQEEYIEAMNELAGKYPNALTPVIDEGGHSFLTLAESDAKKAAYEHDSESLLFTEGGPLRMQVLGVAKASSMDLSALGEFISDQQINGGWENWYKKGFTKPLKTNNDTGARYNVKFSPIFLRDDSIKGKISNFLIASENELAGKVNNQIAPSRPADLRGL